MIEWEAKLTNLSGELHTVARLNDLTAKLISCENVQSAANTAMDAAIEIHQADLGTFQIFRPETRDLEIVAQHGFEEEFLKTFRAVSAVDPCACGRALREQKPILVRDVTTDNEFAPYREIALKAGYRAVVATPMITAEGEMTGVLSTHFREPHLPANFQLHVGTLYARQAGEIVARLKREEARQASRNRDMLAAKELSHRVKNVLTMVQALSRESMKGATGLAEYSDSFNARIRALAHAHEVLSESDWHSTTIERLLKEQLTRNGREVSWSGPEVSINPDQAYVLSLIFHELGVNARKHGALSNGKGRISIEWEITAEEIKLQWVESGGPMVMLPAKTGFGMALIRNLTRTGLIKAEPTYEPTGINWKVELPLTDAKAIRKSS